MLIPYGRLFSLGANFPEFHEWAHSSGKLIQSCCIKYTCGLLVQNLVQAQLCPDRLRTFKPYLLDAMGPVSGLVSSNILHSIQLQLLTLK